LAGVTTLNGGIDNIVTSLVVTNSRPFVLGPAAGDQIRIKIDTEAMLVTAIDYSTHTLTVLRAQDGTSAASHSNGATVQPYTPGADASTPDAVLPVMLGSVSLTGTAHRVKSVTVVIDNQLEPRLDEYGEAALTGYVRTGPLQVTGRIRAYSRQQLHQLLSNYKRETVEDVAIIAGSAGTQRVTINLDRVRFLDPPTVDGGGPSFEFEIPFQALASATPGSDTVNIVFD
jgi:hypothetical protein